LEFSLQDRAIRVEGRAVASRSDAGSVAPGFSRGLGPSSFIRAAKRRRIIPTPRLSDATTTLRRRFAARTRSDIASPQAEAWGYRSVAAVAAKNSPALALLVSENPSAMSGKSAFRNPHSAFRCHAP